MKKLLSIILTILMLVTSVPFAFAADVSLVINMTDSYGDGWNGNAIQVGTVSGGEFTKIADVTIDEGATATYEAAISDENVYAFRWTKGSYTEECSFSIVIGGETVLEASDCNAYAPDDIIYITCNHSFSDSICSICELECGVDFAHTMNSDSECTACGFICSHSYTNHYCKTCKTTENGYYAGVCGAENINDAIWSLDSQGTLTISGTGKYDVEYLNAPWLAYESSIKDVVIEEGITNIRQGSFNELSNAVSLSIPSTVNEIDAYGNNYFAEFKLAEGDSNYALIDGVLFNADKTELVMYPVRKADETYTVPAGVQILGNDSFSSSENLKTINISDDVTTMNESCFFYSSVETVNIGKNVNFIDYNAFCSSDIKNIVLPEKLTEISSSMFYGCKYLENLVIGSHVISIENDVINYCNALEAVHFTGTEAQWEAITKPENETDRINTIPVHFGALEEKTDRDATCGADGHTAGLYCAECDAYLTGEVIPATGEHESYTDGVCDVCGANLDKLVIDVTDELTVDIGKGYPYYDEDGYIITGTNPDAMVYVREETDLTLSNLTTESLVFQYAPDNSVINITLDGTTEVEFVDVYKSHIIFDGGETDTLKTSSFNTAGHPGSVTVNGGNIIIDCVTDSSLPTIICAGGFIINGGTVTASNNYYYVVLDPVTLNGGELNMISTSTDYEAILGSIIIEKGALLTVSATKGILDMYSDIVMADDAEENDYFFVRYDTESEFSPVSDIKAALDGKTYAEIKIDTHEHSFENGKCVCGYECPHEGQNGSCEVCGANLGKLVIDVTDEQDVDIGSGQEYYDEDGYIITGNNPDVVIWVFEGGNYTLDGVTAKSIVDRAGDDTVNITLKGNNVFTGSYSFSKADLIINAVDGATLKALYVTTSGNDGTLTVNGGDITFAYEGNENYCTLECKKIIINGGTVTASNSAFYTVVQNVELNGGILNVVNTSTDCEAIGNDVIIDKGALLTISSTYKLFHDAYDILKAEGLAENDFFFARYDTESEFSPVSDIKAALDGKTYAEIKIDTHEHSFKNGKCVCGYECPHEGQNGSCEVCGANLGKLLIDVTDAEYYVYLGREYADTPDGYYDEDGYILTGTNENVYIAFFEDCEAVFDNLTANAIDFRTPETTIRVLFKGNNHLVEGLGIYEECGVIIDGEEGAIINTSEINNDGNFIFNSGIINIIDSPENYSAIYGDIIMNKAAFLTAENSNRIQFDFNSIFKADGLTESDYFFVRYDTESEFTPVYDMKAALDGKTYAEIKIDTHEHSLDYIGKCICGYECTHESITDNKCDGCGTEGTIVTIEMTDSFGDGWNGNAVVMKLLVDGVNTEVGTATIEYGENGILTAILPKDSIYTFNWVAGDYSDECNFAVVVDGETVYSCVDGSTLTDGQVIYTTCQHDWSNKDGICAKGCGYSCPHENVTDGKCGVCGYECPHIDDVEKHFCTECGITVSECADENGDNICDICNVLIGAPGIFVGGIYVDGSNYTDILGDADEGVTAYYILETNTLVLDGFSYEGADCGIICDGSLNIEVKGENKIVAVDGLCIYAEDDTVINIGGTGKLDIAADSNGIYADSDNEANIEINIKDSVTLNIDSADDGMDIDGRKANKITVNENGSLNIKAVSEGITVSETSESVEILVKDNGTFTVDGEDECIYIIDTAKATVTFTDNAKVSLVNNDEEGIYIDAPESGTVNVSGNADVYIDVEEESIEADVVTVDGGSLKAHSKKSYEGILAADVTVNAGKLIVSSEYEKAISADSIKITGGTLVAGNNTAEYPVFSVAPDFSEYNSEYMVLASEKADATYLVEYDSANAKNYRVITIQCKHELDGKVCKKCGFECGVDCGHYLEEGAVCAICGSFVYAITHQPTETAPYVGLSNDTDASYQWYEIEYKTIEITEENAGTVSYDWGDSSYDAEAGWTGVPCNEGDYGHDFFTLALEAGDTVIIELTGDFYDWVGLYDYAADEDFGEEVVSGVNTYEITVTADGNYTFYTYVNSGVVTVKAYMDDLVCSAIEGETGAVLSNPAYGNRYLCEVTFADGTTEVSDSFEYKYAITHQPTEEEPYVELNDNTDASYQWNTVEEGIVEITDEEATGSWGLLGAPSEIYGEYDSEIGWTSPEGYYFVIELQEGETVELEASESVSEWWIAYVQNPGMFTDEWTVEQYGTTISFTATADGYYGFSTPYVPGVVVRAYMDGSVYIAIDGQTTDTLTPDAIGQYACEVTFADGTTEMSDVFEVTSVHTCDFSGDWKNDAEKHWKECDCGLISEESGHTWRFGECTECGKVCEHSFTSFVETKAPTCTEAGQETSPCDYCDAVNPREIPATNHKDTLVQVEAQAPTCTEIGWDAYEYCTACDYTTYEEIPASHSIVNVDAKAATCTEAGHEAYEYCTACDYTTYKEIPVAEHTEETVKGYAATCEKTGLTDGVKCAICGAVITAQQTIDKLTHKDDNGDYKCDHGCGHEFEKPVEPDTPDEPADGDCDHLCHKSGIMSIFWKIIRFFYRLFNIQQYCDCGVIHYDAPVFG
ncbi:MAG: leucine-rich repeat protein [Clostridia bacterium]|nr:leucine-rich repeat protein [Clostridia bacterium]